MASSIRLGIVGTGRMAATMVRTAGTLPDVEVTAISSGNAERAKHFAGIFGIRHTSTSAVELVSRPDVDAIYVANRTADHVSAAKAAVSAGKPVLVEKPLAVTAEDGAALIAEARARHSLLVENMWCLTLPAYRELATRLTSGTYGKPVHLAFDFGYPMDRKTYPSLFDASDGGVLRDRAVYGVSLALSLLGPVQALRSSVVRNSDGLDVAAAIQLTHASGAISQLAFAINALMSNSATLACTQGVLRLDAPTIGTESISARQMTPLSASDFLKPENSKARLIAKLKAIPALRQLNRRRSAPRATHLSYGADPYRPSLQHFCDLVRAGQKESPIVTLDLSLETLRLVDAARNADLTALET
jgi:predicted dehydrogenase